MILYKESKIANNMGLRKIYTLLVKVTVLSHTEICFCRR